MHADVTALDDPESGTVHVTNDSESCSKFSGSIRVVKWWMLAKGELTSLCAMGCSRLGLLLYGRICYCFSIFCSTKKRIICLEKRFSMDF